MSSSGLYAFDPSLGEATLYAFHLVGVRPTALLQEHMFTARMGANLLLSRWSAQGVNLWAVDLQTVSVVQGTSTYDVPTNTVAMLDAYIVQNSSGSAINRLILPISRSEYASYPNPEQEGAPTVYWFDRLLSPTVTLWPVPDGEQSAFSYYRVRQLQDANFTAGQTVEIPYYFSDAFALGLAARLALSWAPDKADRLAMLAKDAWEVAANQNVETSSIFISPIISNYFSP